MSTARRHASILAVWFALLVPNLAAAQVVPRELTLEEALRLAQEWNPAYRRALAQADASGADVLAATGQFLPNLNGSLGFDADRSTVATGQDDFGGNLELEQSRTIERSYSSQGLSSQLTLFDGFQNINGLKGARAGSRAAHHGVDAQAAILDAEVKRRFYQSVRLQQLVAIEERLLGAREDELVATDRLFRVAAREQVDVLGAQVEVARQEQNLQSALGEAEKALLALGEIIGLEEVAEFEIVGGFPEVFDPELLDREELVARALRLNPGLQQAFENAARAGHEAASARGIRWPTIYATARFTRSVGQEGYGGLFQFNPQDNNMGLGLNLSFPLFTRFNTSQTIAQADMNRETADENLRETRLQLEREVRSAHIDVQNSYRQLQLAERSAELGRQRLAMAQEQYQLGSRSFTELQQIVNVSASDERSALTARLNYVTAVIGLEQLVGGPVSP
jgi:outer membrane protein